MGLGDNIQAKKISELDDAADLAGDELFVLLQNGQAKKTNISQIADLSGSSIPDGGAEGQVLAKVDGSDGNVEWADQPVGVPDGGAAGQVLAKVDNTDGNLHWASQPNGVPDGGSTGQVLAKVDGDNGNAHWINPAEGVPNGGNAGQVLAKVDNTDGNLHWADQPLGLPIGGTIAQVLAKINNADGNAHWVSPSEGVPDGGSAGQVLAKVDNTNGNVHWVDQSSGGGGSQPVWNRKGVAIPAVTTADESLTAEATVIFEGSPKLLTQATGSVFKMWFTQGYADVNIMYAESLDGINWVRKAEVCVANHARSCVLKVGSTYYMYASLGVTGVQIDRYTSTDGVTWALGTSAVITRDAAWNNSSVANSSVYYDSSDSTWKMLVEGNDTTTGLFKMGYYHSTDGVTWTPYASNPVIIMGGGRSCGGPDIQKIGGVFQVWGHGTPAGYANLPGELYRWTSTDMINWTIANSGSPILARLMSNEGVGALYGQLADPTLVEANGKTYIYYTGVTDGHQQSLGQVKVAVSSLTMAQIAATTEGDNGVLEPALTDAYTKTQADIRYLKNGYTPPGQYFQKGEFDLNGVIRLITKGTDGGGSPADYPIFYVDHNILKWTTASGDSGMGIDGSGALTITSPGNIQIQTNNASGAKTSTFDTNGNLNLAGVIGLQNVGVSNGSTLDVVGISPSGNGGITRMKGFRRLLFANTDVAVLYNSASKNSIIPSGVGSTSNTVAQQSAAVGMQYIVRFGGVYSTLSTPGTILIEIKYCGVVMATATVSSLTASANKLRFACEVTIATLTKGDFSQTVYGTVVVDGEFNHSTGDGSAKKSTQLSSDTAINVYNGAYPNPIEVNAQWDTADSGKILKVTRMSIESINY